VSTAPLRREKEPRDKDLADAGRASVSGWLRRKFTRKGRADAEIEVAESEVLDFAGELTQHDYDFEATGDLRYVNMKIDVNLIILNM
jgi:hypothetical protein